MNKSSFVYFLWSNLYPPVKVFYPDFEKKTNFLIEPTKPLLVVSSMTVPTQMVILNGLVSQYSKVMWSVIWIEVPILLPPMHLRLL